MKYSYDTIACVWGQWARSISTKSLASQLELPGIFVNVTNMSEQNARDCVMVFGNHKLHLPQIRHVSDIFRDVENIKINN